MSCNCRTIVGALGKKVKLIELHFTADTTAFTAGDAIYTSPVTVQDVFDLDNGNGKVLEYRIEQRNATTVTKKGITAILFHTQPASASVAINAAEGVTAIDFVKISGILPIVTADYLDTSTATEVMTTAIKTSNTDDLPIIWNDDSSNKRALWFKLIATEAMTFTAGALVHVVIQVECF